MQNSRLSIASILVVAVQTGHAGSGQKMQNGSKAVVNSTRTQNCSIALLAVKNLA